MGCIDQRQYDMNGKTQMQGGKNWKNHFCPSIRSNFLEVNWKKHFCPSMKSNGGSVAMDLGMKAYGEGKGIMAQWSLRGERKFNETLVRERKGHQRGH
jgi:hypothetical protein